MVEVTETTLIMVDAEGRTTDNRDEAVRGEIVETLSDGTTRSTMVTIVQKPPAEGSAA